MTVQMRHAWFGKTFGINYWFDDVGDGLRMHRHTDSEAHSVYVLHGEVWIYGPYGTDKITAKAGDHIEIAWDKWHEIRCMTPKVALFNAYVHGQPEGYDTLPESELTGHYDVALSHHIDERGELVMNPEFRSVFA